MKQILKYSSVIALSFVIATPALAALVLPTPPPGGPPGLTASRIVEIITSAVNYLIIISTVVAVGMFIYGAIKYAVMGDPKEGGKTMKNAAIALLAILGVGLLINTIAGLVNRGLNLG